MKVTENLYLGFSQIEEEFYVGLVKFLTETILDHTENQSETLKIITVGVQSAIKSHEKKGKELNR